LGRRGEELVGRLGRRVERGGEKIWIFWECYERFENFNFFVFFEKKGFHPNKINYLNLNEI
jgi:hypothetical protein